jgi:cyclic beta-1,2-glucan synthetase
MYRAGLESMLGLSRRGSTFSIEPCVPASWARYEISWRHRSTQYEIVVLNPDGRCDGVAAATLDGLPIAARQIPLLDDGGTHRVEVILGASLAPERPLRPIAS